MGRTQIFVRLSKMTGLILEKLQIGKKQKTFFVKESEILSEFAWTDLNLGFLICVHASDIKNMRSPIDSLDWQIARAADLLLILRCAAKLIQLLAYNRSWMKGRDPISIFCHFQFRQLNLNQWNNTCIPLIIIRSLCKNLFMITRGIYWGQLADGYYGNIFSSTWDVRIISLWLGM